MHVGKQFASATQARLNLIRNQQYMVLPADFCGLPQKSRWRNDDSRFALNRLDQKSARVRSDGIAKSFRIAERDDLESRRERPEAIAILFVAREADHTSELQSLRHLVCRLLLEK